MRKNVFIWVAHPKAQSFCAGLADAYQAGARAAGHYVQRMDLANMDFAEHFDGYEGAPALEKDLLKWQEHIREANHIFIVHPYWWGAMPARAKSVLDRGLTPGFAYKYHKKGVKWDKLLEGKTADVVITSDTPSLIDQYIYHRPGRRVLTNQVLGFCGIAVRKALQFGSVKMANSKRLQKWLGKAEKMGRTL